MEYPQRKKIRLSAERYLERNGYFLTMCTHERVARFRQAGLVAQLRSMLKDCAAGYMFDISAYCFMPDHLHLLTMGRQESSDLLAFARAFKQRSGFFLGRRHRLWQKNYYDHILRREDSWEAVAWYIWMNPVRKGLCERPQGWPFSGSFTLDWPSLLAPAKEWVPPWRAARPGIKPGPTQDSSRGVV